MMDNLDKVRARQKTKSERLQKRKAHSASGISDKSNLNNPGVKRTVSAAASAGASEPKGSARKSPSKRSRKKRSSVGRIILNTFKLLFLIVFAAAIGLGIWVFSIVDFEFGDDLSTMNLNISSKVYYTDALGDPIQYAQFDASEKRIWVPIDKMPKNIKNAFVSIEDHRFFRHRGVDLKRTIGATMNYLLKGDSSYGGSTITQQLVKNITEDNERTKSRKIREILRSLVLETKLSKEQILEMYLNTIYLGQGANGVEAASHIYFSKDVSELSLAECACIAGITQYPTKYDPILQPEANKEKRLIILEKMLEFDYINREEYEQAVNEEVQINVGKTNSINIQSYFLDHLFEEVQEDLVAKGYTADFAANMIYNGGLKIYSTVDPHIQGIMEDYFENNSNFPGMGGDVKPQSAMVISDPYTGGVKGIVGGIGEKNLNRGLNRATHSKRQPGSSIKPVAVYAPALDLGLITQSTIVDDSPLDINGWKPKNSGGSFRGNVSVETAVTYSYNIPAVRVLEEVGVERSFDYMKNKLHVDSLVDNREKNGKSYTDKTLASLALGGLTDGVTVMEMNGAYSALANGGTYIEPHTYTKVYDVEGKIILSKETPKERVFKESTAFLMSEMLKKVVSTGTGAGAAISGIDTCGKTGTTDAGKDRWFIGYTPYYCGSVWFGYDNPRTISAGGNPALNVWDNIMSKIHSNLQEKHFEVPGSVEKLLVCRRTGLSPSYSCSRVTQYADVSAANNKCEGKHEYIGTKPYKSIYKPKPQEEEESSQEEIPIVAPPDTGNSDGQSENETTFAPESENAESPSESIPVQVPETPAELQNVDER